MNRKFVRFETPHDGTVFVNPDCVMAVESGAQDGTTFLHLTTIGVAFLLMVDAADVIQRLEGK